MYIEISDRRIGDMETEKAARRAVREFYWQMFLSFGAIMLMAAAAFILSYFS